MLLKQLYLIFSINIVLICICLFEQIRETPLKGKVKNVLTWRWTIQPNDADELDHTHTEQPEEVYIPLIYHLVLTRCFFGNVACSVICDLFNNVEQGNGEDLEVHTR